MSAKHWYMTDNEISVMYKNAKNPATQIGIISELNLKTQKEVILKLEHLGFDMEKYHGKVFGVETFYEHRGWSNTEKMELIRMREQGKRFGEISSVLMRSQKSCCFMYRKLLNEVTT